MSLDLELALSAQLAHQQSQLQINQLAIARKDSDISVDISSNPQSNQAGKSYKKYKTQLCKNYSEKGRCPYNTKCRFAHGYEQLQGGKRDLNKNFKTRKCKSYWKEGFCSYGIRCQFEHQGHTNSQTSQYLHIWRKLLTPNCGGDASRLLSITSTINSVVQRK